MNRDQIDGGRKQVADRAKASWGEITGDEWTQIAGRKDQIVGMVQARYGRAKEDAEREVDDWMRTL